MRRLIPNCYVTIAMLLAIFALSPGKGAAFAKTSQEDWHVVDAGPFSILAPAGWEYHKTRSVDSIRGEFVGAGVTLDFDLGRYSDDLGAAREPKYDITQKSIGGHPAKLVSPRIPGQGVTGIYFREISKDYSLSLMGQNLTSAQQELVLKIFETIRFGRRVPDRVHPHSSEQPRP